MKREKKALAAALKKTDQLPNEWFGTDEATIEDLPSLRRSRRVRRNIFLEQPTVDVLDKLCAKHHVSFTEVANDILTKYANSLSKKKLG